MPTPDQRRTGDTSVSNHLIRARILVVEDQRDVRGLIVTALEIEGHQVDEASNAHEGLQKLQERRYDLVLTDFAMPGGTGTWMLDEADRAGLLTHTSTLIVTAHADARELAPFDVVAKPLDLDHFLGQVRTILDKRPASIDVTDEPATVRHAHRVELVLYVSPNSPASAQARRNLELLLNRFDPSQVKCSICDLTRDPHAGDRDRVAFTPTLVKRYPTPRMFVLGNLREVEVVADLIRGCGVDAKT